MLNHLPLEEKWNVYTHGFGAVISLLGIIWIFSHQSHWIFGQVWGFLSMAFLWCFYFRPPLYTTGKIKVSSLLAKIDHIGIFLLIVGSYTPVTLTILKESSGYYLLAGVWLLRS